jgi:hypothetical protein
MAQLKNVVEPFGEVNVHTQPDGSLRVWASILMEPDREGTQTGIALDGSGSMRKLYGQDTGGGVLSPIFAKPKVENIVTPVAQQLCAYLARKIDADHGTTCIYWATGNNGSQVEVVGDLTADQAEQYTFKGPRDFGTGTQLLPAVRYFVDRFKDAPWGFFVFVTDGELFDLDEVKRFSTQLAREIAAGRRRPVKFVLIGVGPDVNERQLEELDDLDTGTEVDLWDHKMAAEMRMLQEIFAEVVDRNARVAEGGRILDPQGQVIRDFHDTGLPALLRFVMPRGATHFVLEVNGQRIAQALSDSVALPPQPVQQPTSFSAPPPPVVPPVSKAPPVAPAPPKAQEKQGWDKEPIDLELDELARKIDLQFETPAAHEASKAPPVQPKAKEPAKDTKPVDLELAELARKIDLQFEDPAAHEKKPGDKK